MFLTHVVTVGDESWEEHLVKDKTGLLLRIPALFPATPDTAPSPYGLQVWYDLEHSESIKSRESDQKFHSPSFWKPT